MIEKQPAISVIMSTYHEEGIFLRKAIESVLTQTFTDFEFLIAVDDPQNDGLIGILKEYASRDQRVRVHINKENMGLSASLNALLEEATGDYIARMDADDISMPERLEKQIAYMKKTQADMISCDVDVIDEHDNTIQKMTNLPSTDAKIKKKLCINNCMPHPGWMVRAEVYHTLEGYRATPYCEDYEFLLRARNYGYTLGNINEELLRYRMTNISISRSNLYRQYLAMKYCQSKYIKGQKWEWEEYLKTHFDEDEQTRYNKSANLFTEGLSALRQHRLGSAFVCLWRAFWGSACYRDKMIKYLKQVL